MYPERVHFAVPRWLWITALVLLLIFLMNLVGIIHLHGTIAV